MAQKTGERSTKGGIYCCKFGSGAGPEISHFACFGRARLGSHLTANSAFLPASCLSRSSSRPPSHILTLLHLLHHPSLSISLLPRLNLGRPIFVIQGIVPWNLFPSRLSSHRQFSASSTFFLSSCQLFFHPFRHHRPCLWFLTNSTNQDPRYMQDPAND